MLIGEVARRSGVSTRMLRHYESLGLVRPTGRTVGNYREYAAEDIRRIFHVESLRTLGLSLREIGRALQDPGFEPSALVAGLIRRTEERLARERELLERLHAVDASAPAGWDDVLRIVELLRGLHSANASRRQQAVLAPGTGGAVPAEVLADAVLSEPDPNVAGALRWALARAGGDGVAGVARGVTASDPAVRLRAVRALAGIEGGEASAALRHALDDGDDLVRRQAALALGRRGVADGVPVLVRMIVDGVNDVEAAEVLGTLARDDEDDGVSHDGSGGAREDRDPEARRGRAILAAVTAEFDAAPPVRIRLTQALAELPAALTRDVLEELSGDPDRTVAALAAALSGRPPRSPRPPRPPLSPRPPGSA